MKRKISKFLAIMMAFMVVVTSAVPANVFAAQVEDSTVSAENTVSENGQDTVQTPEIADEEEIISENNADTFGEKGKLNFLYLGNKYIESPGEQNVLAGYGDDETVLISAKLEVQNYRTKEISSYYSEETMDNAVLFNMGFSPEEAGIYEITGVSFVTEDGEEKHISLSETGMAKVYFGVDEEVMETGDITAEPDASVEMQIVTFDEEGVSDVETEEITAAVEDALNEAGNNVNAAPKRRASLSSVSALASEADANGRGANGEIVVVLDPGHDATHKGASANGLNEEELTLKIAQYCKAELEQYSGVKVYMTRTSGSCPYPGTSSTDDNKRRVDYARSVGADIYVSIHLNSSGIASAHGAEVFYPNSNYNGSIGSQGASLATQISRQLAALGLSNRGITIRNSEDKTTYPDGSLADYYGVIRNSKLAGFPAVIVEHAFLTNASDVDFLRSEANLKKLGIADATGIANYLGVTKSGITASKIWVPSYKNEYFKGQFIVQIDGVKPIQNVKSIKVAAFTKSDLSDLAWYDAIYYGNYTYAITIDSDYHNRNSGFYIAQVYAETNSGALQHLGTTYCNLTFGKPTPPSGASLSISNINSATGTFEATVGSVVAEGGVKSVRVGVYTPGINNLAYYTASRQGDGTYKIQGNIKNHKYMYGTYNVLVYVTDNYGQETCVASKTISITRPEATMSYSQGNGNVNITLKGFGVDGSISSMTFAVWSENGGRDDLAFYSGTKSKGDTWTASVPIKNHKSEGKYNVQVGISDGVGNFAWAKNGEFYVEGPKGGSIAITNVNGQNGSFDVLVGSITSSSGIAKVQLAVWCQGDDYYAYQTLPSNGVYLAHVDNGNHKYRYGTYVVRVVAEDNNGIESIVATQTVNLPRPDPFLGVTENTNQSQYGLVAANLGNSKGINSVKFAVWSEENGRDDFRLYSAYSPTSGVYISNVEIKNHKSYGKYYVQVGVFYKDGTSTWCAESTFNVDAPKMGKVEFGPFYNMDNIFYGRIYGVKAQGVKNIIVPVWSQSNQSDIYFYMASLQADGSYLFLGNTANHRFNSGTYYAQIYVEDNIGITTFLGMKTCKLTAKDASLYAIRGKGNTNVQQMMNYYNSKTTYPTFYANSDAPTLQAFCQMYIDECNAEGINPEVAFVQAMKETNFLRYTGDVQIEQYNFAGIGATGGGAQGNAFPDVRTGIRAQVQHLKAYATSEALVNPCVDPRYTYVQKGSAPYVQWLGIKENPSGAGWATAVNYGYSIVDMIKSMKNY